MFKKNVGSIDRVLRIALGIALLAAYFLQGNPLFLIGIVPLATGLMSSCPLYSIIGLSTCPVKK